MNPFPNSCCSRVVFIRRLLGDIDCETEVDRCLISSIGERKWKVRRNSSSLFIYLFLTIEISIWNWHLLMYSYDLELIKNYYKFIKNFGSEEER